MENVMQNDMRLKRVIVKGPGALKILNELPCENCEESKNCLCDGLKNFIAKNCPCDKQKAQQPSGENDSSGANTLSACITSLELEWMQVHTDKCVVSWKKVAVFLAVILFITVMITSWCLIKGCREGGRTDSIKVSLSGNVYQIERYVESVQDFEKRTNDLDRIAIELQALKRGVKQ